MPVSLVTGLVPYVVLPYVKIRNAMLESLNQIHLKTSKDSSNFSRWKCMEMYIMGNSVLIKCEAEMTHLQPNLGDARHQELRRSPFCPSPLFRSQLV